MLSSRTHIMRQKRSSIGHPSSILAAATACVTALAGCTNLQTRPGNPDSYRVGLWGGSYYAGTGLDKLEWPTTGAAASQSGNDTIADLQMRGVPIRDIPPIYKATSVPREVWQARGAAWNLHLKYLASSFKAGDVQDALAIPLVGSAVATVALGIAKGSAASIAAVGLGGGAVYAGYSYAHPDRDLSTDQAAAFALVCVVDQSLPLRTMSVVPLILDKAALQDALDQLSQDAGPLMGLTSPSTSQKATQQAVVTAQSAAKQTMSNLDANINYYDNMPTVIYSTVDQIDKTAQTGGVRQINYSGILSSLQAAATNKSANTNAQTSVSQAAQQTSTASANASGTDASAVAKPTSSPASPTNLLSLTSPATSGDGRSAVAPSQPDTTTDPGKSGTNQTNATNLTNTLESTDTSDLQKVTKIAADANEDLAVVDYQAVSANVQACTTGQPVAPVTTQQSPSAPVTGQVGD